MSWMSKSCTVDEVYIYFQGVENAIEGSCRHEQRLQLAPTLVLIDHLQGLLDGYLFEQKLTQQDKPVLRMYSCMRSHISLANHVRR